MVTTAPQIGVLALQGDVAEHSAMLEQCGSKAVAVRNSSQLSEVDGLIIPGGESTTIAKLIDMWELRTHILSLAGRGVPIWGTCAGMIMMSERVEENEPEPLRLMDYTVKRNYFGRQFESFEEELMVRDFDDPLSAVFIRAPAATEVGPAVEVLATLKDGTAVALRQGKMLATAFHPELTDDLRFHRLFVNEVLK